MQLLSEKLWLPCISCSEAAQFKNGSRPYLLYTIRPSLTINFTPLTVFYKSVKNIFFCNRIHLITETITCPELWSPCICCRALEAGSRAQYTSAPSIQERKPLICSLCTKYYKFAIYVSLTFVQTLHQIAFKDPKYGTIFHRKGKHPIHKTVRNNVQFPAPPPPPSRTASYAAHD